ncbi:hypothetical protein B0H15DRAFT_803122 [Mycena belliarum]|uniref:DUF6532 domain-containing protein n=1 Tax=Mycena belliarum TaxID=1033014 RepID=A0AAD6U2K3_9AGAR|nr:hypothetical protein B0H15DRAFT_803122 [Mycena belliae]
MPQRQAALVPANYTPIYPNFSPHQPSSLSHSHVPAQPDPQESAAFAAMMAQMSPTALSQLMSFNPDYGGPAGPNNSDVNYPRGYNGDYSSDINYNNSSSDDMAMAGDFLAGNEGGEKPDEGSSGCAFVSYVCCPVADLLQLDNDNDHNNNNDPPWNNEPADTDDQAEEEPDENVHRNAQSSLDAKEDAQASGPSLRGSYPFVQKEVATTKPWPAASPSGDPAAADDEVERLLDQSWDRSVDSLGLLRREVEGRTDEESNLMIARISQFRGAVMTIADKLVPGLYGFVAIGDLEDATPAVIAATIAANRKLVDDLCGTFMYEDPKQTNDLSTICGHKVFQKLLNLAFFADSGANRRAHYFNGKEILPTETMGFLMDAVVCAIDRWKTGRYSCRSAPFEAKTYAAIHQDTMVFLEKWLLEYKLEVHPVDLATERLKGMLSKARKLCDTSVEEVETRPSMFPLHVFTQPGGAPIASRVY